MVQHEEYNNIAVIFLDLVVLANIRNFVTFESVSFFARPNSELKLKHRTIV